ncbi:MAG TPA: large conductance mechanosensitive channel protein MscL [Verrucomicrobiae bacterium]|nr:large conductance mechanosensitive channel protein MscL [Verrucomicrobiae bacterium]
MKIIQEFKAFAMRGNVVDLAIAVIIGGAFGNIVNSLVKDIIMPPIGKVIGNLDFSNLYVPLSEKIAQQAAAYRDAHNGAHLPLAEAQNLGPVLAWGNFVTVTLNFIILAFCIFIMIKIMNKVIRHQQEAPAPPTPTEQLLTEIRDILKNKP